MLAPRTGRIACDFLSERSALMNHWGDPDLITIKHGFFRRAPRQQWVNAMLGGFAQYLDGDIRSKESDINSLVRHVRRFTLLELPSTSQREKARRLSDGFLSAYPDITDALVARTVIKAQNEWLTWLKDRKAHFDEAKRDGEEFEQRMA